MRRYDDVIDVRRGLVAGQEAPEQFLWRDRLWVVRDVLAHWVETGAWWEQAGVSVLLGIGSAGGAGGGVSTGGGVSAGGAGAPDVGWESTLGGPRWGAELLAERDLWRVEAGRGQAWAVGSSGGAGVFELAFDWAEARWRLVGCLD